MLPRTDTTARWRNFWVGVGAVLTAAYFAARWWRGGFQHGGSPAGIAYGIFGTVAILVLLAFGVRKRWYRSTWGTLDGWLQSHIYLGLLSALVIFFHSGFRFQDRVAVAAFVTLGVVVASGFVGASLYTSVPRRLSEVESDLTPAELSAQIQQLADGMARIAGSRSFGRSGSKADQCAHPRKCSKAMRRGSRSVNSSAASKEARTRSCSAKPSATSFPNQ